jgi:hypothetical protein
MVSVYSSENLGNFEETTKPVLVKDPCTKTLNIGLRSQKRREKF